MAKPARQRETLHSRAIYNFHPLFANADFVTYYGDDDLNHLPASVEGGDVHVIGNGTVMIGMGERTLADGGRDPHPAPLHLRPGADKVIAVELPKSHSMMHLDTAMTMVDRATFVLYPYFDRHLRSWTITPGEDGGFYVSHNHNLWETLARGVRGRGGDGAHDRRGHPCRRA